MIPSLTVLGGTILSPLNEARPENITSVVATGVDAELTTSFRLSGKSYVLIL